MKAKVKRDSLDASDRLFSKRTILALLFALAAFLFLAHASILSANLYRSALTRLRSNHQT